VLLDDPADAARVSTPTVRETQERSPARADRHGDLSERLLWTVGRRA